MSPTPFVSRLIDALKAKCPLKCGWNGSLNDLRSHIHDTCPYYLVECDCCGNAVARSQLSYHQTIVCTAKCSKCEMEVMRMIMDAHIDVCTQKLLFDG